tara:strand:- start:896 stop:1336 length:441 start_codon:yes stop_codon:yes gene_type:complete
MGQFDSMEGAESYLFFLNGANTDVCFKADDLLWMEKDGSAALNLYFRSPLYTDGILTDDTDNNVAQAWQTRGQCKIIVAVATGKGKTVMKSIIAACNAPISVGDPNANHDRGFIVVADDINSTYVDANITAVTSITFDAKATDAIA